MVLLTKLNEESVLTGRIPVHIFTGKIIRIPFKHLGTHRVFGHLGTFILIAKYSHVTFQKCNPFRLTDGCD